MNTRIRLKAVIIKDGKTAWFLFYKSLETAILNDWNQLLFPKNNVKFFTFVCEDIVLDVITYGEVTFKYKLNELVLNGCDNETEIVDIITSGRMPDFNVDSSNKFCIFKECTNHTKHFTEWENTGELGIKPKNVHELEAHLIKTFYSMTENNQEMMA